MVIASRQLALQPLSSTATFGGGSAATEIAIFSENQVIGAGTPLGLKQAGRGRQGIRKLSKASSTLACVGMLLSRGYPLAPCTAGTQDKKTQGGI